ncbi:hypothetical protein MIR68_002051 [Amoeboaphelidium protococcarum]|nr:hypothetical protein MIR68_005458 [Amoeboaphelidium protococcarum]KAI3639923.1 hypothetical protein MIR68_002051 [Amoeboaphelidium protococcarum]KAI3646707.1 hypothetical protein MP228_009635 [Amoeboaphelidium protococcarum]KAI3647064.1 hypothetical protein MP228_007285 [Amoeboaphelidium protococcarum]
MSDDWDKVTVLKKRTNAPKTATSASQINAARRDGAVLAVEKKMTAGNKPKNMGTDLNAAKLDRETEELTVKTVGMEVGKAIAQARADKGMTQKDLAVKINEKQQVIQEYENGKAVPNQQILAKMERNLGVKLRGKDIGTPLAPRGSAKK